MQNTQFSVVFRIRGAHNKMLCGGTTKWMCFVVCPISPYIEHTITYTHFMDNFAWFQLFALLQILMNAKIARAARPHFDSEQKNCADKPNNHACNCEPTRQKWGWVIVATTKHSFNTCENQSHTKQAMMTLDKNAEGNRPANRLFFFLRLLLSFPFASCAHL